MVIIFSNGQYNDRSAGANLKPANLGPVLRVTNTGCWRWQGTIKLTVPRASGVQETATTNVVLERDSDQYHSLLGFHVWSGRTSWQVSGTDTGRWHCS